MLQSQSEVQFISVIYRTGTTMIKWMDLVASALHEGNVFLCTVTGLLAFHVIK